MGRELWESIADEAARDPSRAVPLARYLVELLRQAEQDGDERPPPGYIYSGAHTWLAIAEDIVVEPLPPPDTAVPIASSANRTIKIEVPFDALVMGVAGWASPDFRRFQGFAAAAPFLLASSAADFRDVFSVQWGLDGKIWFQGDGEEDLMAPAAVVVGSRRSPRALGWTVRRNQTIQVRFRNLYNVIFPTTLAANLPHLRRVGLAFYALNLEAP